MFPLAMRYVDFILNLAGLLLWLNWRAIRFDPLDRRTPATLMGTLRPAAPQKLRRWHLLAFIAGLLLARAVVYRWVAGWLGASVWVGQLNLGVTALSFRSNDFLRILIFSVLSFGLMLGIFYLLLLLLSLLRGPEPLHRLVKIPLGQVDGWPWPVKALLPLLVTVPVWGLLAWLLARLQVLPPVVSPAQWLEQSLAIGLRAYLLWLFPVATLLVLHLLNSYIYFGPHPFWNYVRVTAQKLLRPLALAPLRMGRVDFAPVAALVLVFLAAEAARRGLTWVYPRLPL